MMNLSAKEKAIVCGLYLSKFDREGVKRMGFETIDETFRAWGKLLAIKPLTIRNHRDHFDKHFPNRRKGWQTPLSPALEKMYVQFKDHTIEELSEILGEWGLK